MTIHDILRKHWEYDSFRSMQEDIIQSVLQNRDTLALLPTGGGKSVCFQVPAIAKKGLCIVVSPLIALMKDQVQQLQKRGITAEAIFTGMSKRWQEKALEKAVNGEIKFLYVSPERLKSRSFKERVKYMPITLLAIDEAHCISQWGYDFRPPYLEIADFRQLLPPQVPVIALTATATDKVKLDIQEKLNFPKDETKKSVFQKSFARNNLSYSVFRVEDKETKLLQILQNVKGTAVVYVRNRKSTQLTAEMLQRKGISADYYHAGLSPDARSQKQDDWIDNKIRVIVATNAFGMGIDKPDVRVVVHLEMPDSLEAYYQEAGRAGRDEKKAYAVALYQNKDLETLENRVLEAYPPLQTIQDAYQMLADYCQIPVGNGGEDEVQAFDFDWADFQTKNNLTGNATFFAIKKLEEQGFVQINENYTQASQFMFVVDRMKRYEFQTFHTGFAPLFRVLERIYGGMGEGFWVKFSEIELANVLKTNQQEIIRQLNYLDEVNIIQYQTAQTKSQLLWLTQRYDAQMLPFNLAKMEERKQAHLMQIRAVSNYAQSNHRCRTEILLAYFGENYDQCGVCDVCLEKKKSEQLAHSTTSILATLGKEELSITDLAKKLNMSEKDLSYILREMADSQLIEIENNKVKRF